MPSLANDLSNQSSNRTKSETMRNPKIIWLFSLVFLTTIGSACNKCTECECVGNQTLEICRNSFDSKADWQEAVGAAEGDDACDCKS